MRLSSPKEEDIVHPLNYSAHRVLGRFGGSTLTGPVGRMICNREDGPPPTPLRYYQGELETLEATVPF